MCTSEVFSILYEQNLFLITVAKFKKNAVNISLANSAKAFLAVMQFRKKTERVKTWFSKMSSCISFHISNSSAALYSRVSLGSGWFSGAQWGWVWGTCRCWPAPTHWYNNSRFLTGNPSFQGSVQGKRVRFI